MKKIISSVFYLLMAVTGYCQGDNAQSNQLMTSHLKIYVSIAVLGIILSCIFIFLFFIEKRLKQLEEKQKS